MEVGKQENPELKPSQQGENQQQTQPSVFLTKKNEDETNTATWGKSRLALKRKQRFVLVEMKVLATPITQLIKGPFIYCI